MSDSLKEYYQNERAQDWRVELRKKMKAKERMDMYRANMPAQQPEVRNKNGLEVNLGLTEEMAVKEAHRCFDCNDPTCIQGCR